MATSMILVDWRPAYAGESAVTASLLLTPVADRTVLGCVWPQLASAARDGLVIVPNFEPDQSYREAVAAACPAARVCPTGALETLLDTLEASDWLMVVDGRHYPVEGLNLRVLMEDAADCRLTWHITRLRRNGRLAHERVVYDETLRVRSIERLYAGVTELDTVGVSCSMISVAVARRLDLREVFCPALIRRQLSVLGIPGRDVASSGRTVDLATEAGLLELNERLTAAAMRTVPAPPLACSAPRIWQGPKVRVAPSARLYGPVIMHGGAVIEADAVIVGPVVMGAGSRVERGAVVAACVLGVGARVPAGAERTQRVLAAGSDNVVDREAVAAQPGVFTLPEEAPPVSGPRWYPALKRAFDFQAALCGLLVLSPLLLVVAALVKLTSRGPVFFGHEREGRGGRVFRCWKFRTMVDNAHALQRRLYQQNAVDGPQFKMADDPRITRIGKWLRLSNIDELPQLFNVLRGEMSLIGPRPSPFRENQICVPWRKARLSVRPGITGLWQVCRHERAAGDFHQWIFFDVLYVRHVSLGLDLRVLVATFLTLGGRWAVPLRRMIPAYGRGSRAVAIVPPPRAVAARDGATRRRRRRRRTQPATAS